MFTFAYITQQAQKQRTDQGEIAKLDGAPSFIFSPVRDTKLGSN